MFFYILFSILTVLCFLDYFIIKPRKIDKTIFIIICFVLVIVAGTRLNVGYDYNSYKLWFQSVKDEQLSVFYIAQKLNIELGFALYLKILTYFSYNAFIFITAVICIVPKIYYIYKLNRNKYLMLLGYYALIFIFYDIGVIRQALSISILVFSYKYIMKKEPIKFITVVIFATLFHMTAILFLPMYFIGENKFPLKIYVSIGVISIALQMINFANIIEKIINLLNISVVSSRFMFYQYYNNNSLFISLLKRVCVLFIFVFLLYWNRKRKIQLQTLESRAFWLCLNAYSLSVLLFSVLSFQALLAGRGVTSLYIFQIGCFALLPEKNNRLIHILLNVIFVLLMFNTLQGPVTDVNGEYAVYNSWLFK